MPDLQSFIAALQVGGVMIYPLLGLTVLATVIILEKAFVYAVRTRLPARLIGLGIRPEHVQTPEASAPVLEVERVASRQRASASA